MGLLFYILPAIVDITVGVFFFISAKRMADSGASSYMVALTMAVWAIVYAVSSFAAGRIITRPVVSRLVSPRDAPAVYRELAESKAFPLGTVFDWRETT